MRASAASVGLPHTIACCALLLVVGGCATAIHGRSQKIQVEIAPEGTEVEVRRWNGESIVKAVSPQEIELPRPANGQSYLVLARHDGYCPRYVLTEVSPSAMGTVDTVMFLATLGIGWLIPMTIDASTGAAFELPSEPFHGTLVEASACAE